MTDINLSNIRKECNEDIARQPPDRVAFYCDIHICDGDDHSQECHGRMECGEPCILVAAEAAKGRLKRLEFLPLLTGCARNPAKANGLHTLEGMAVASCIYDIKYACNFHEREESM